MADVVALWADSTYGCIEASRLMDVAAELDFPLSSFTCAYGAGLATRGDESAERRCVARNVVVEMGYNDDSSLSQDEAAKRMRMQPWFAHLSSSASAVERVIFIAQPGYRQVAGAARRRRNRMYEMGQLIEGSAWTAEAARLVREELGIDTFVFDVPAEEIYVGFTRDEKGELWQDKASCRAYTDHGIEYSEDGKPAMWCDAQHPSESGAEGHFRLLVKDLKLRFGDLFSPSRRRSTCDITPTALPRPLSPSHSIATSS